MGLARTHDQEDDDSEQEQGEEGERDEGNGEQLVIRPVLGGGRSGPADVEGSTCVKAGYDTGCGSMASTEQFRVVRVTPPVDAAADECKSDEKKESSEDQKHRVFMQLGI